MDNGWIKIHRKIIDHWVYKNDAYFKAWICIIATVNHDDKKVFIYDEVLNCDRGQSVLSLASWVKLFGKGWTMQKVRTFFKLLEADDMIVTEGLRKTTRLTVCNYDNYQVVQQAANKQLTSSQQAANNKQECKELIKNEKKREGAKKFTPPTQEEVIKYFEQNSYSAEAAIKAFNYYDIAQWHDSKGNKVKNWKQKMQAVWFKDENKQATTTTWKVLTPQDKIR